MGQAVDRVRRLAMGEPVASPFDRQGEQLGQTDAVRPAGFLMWLMTETSAEAGPAAAITQALEAHMGHDVHMLVTPIESAALVPKVEHAVIHQFAPGDTDGTIKRFLDHWHPDVGLVINHPSRPKLLSAARKRGIPLYHVAADRAGISSSRNLPLYLKVFDTCFAASASDANFKRTHLRKSQTRVETTGPLADTTYALPCNAAECDELAKVLGGRPVWLAAEVTADEIKTVEAAHRKAFRSAHRLLLVLVPRRGLDPDEIATELEDAGWRVARRSEMEEPDPEVQIYVADSVEELGLWYRLAPTSFIGGSLEAGVEPSDPFDAAALGSAVLHGPNHGTNPSRFKTLHAHGASMNVTDAGDLGDAVISLLAPDKAASLAQAGWAATTESAHVVERLAEVIGDRFLDAEPQ